MRYLSRPTIKNCFSNLLSIFLCVLSFSLLLVSRSLGQEEPTKCFENVGLKYLVKIYIHVNNNDIYGYVSSSPYDDAILNTADFRGTIKDNLLTIKFQSEPPIGGRASEWTKQPWRIENSDGKESLIIGFYAKNYETGEWGNTDYMYTPCKE